MSRFQERTRGVTVHKLDMSGPDAEVLAYANETATDGRTIAKVNNHGPWALAEKPDGTPVLVCGEGVGWEIADGKVEFEWSYTWETEDGKTSFSIMPNVSANISLDELKALPSEEVDLADFVRVFGDRLESNFWIWRQELAAKVDA